VLPLPEFGVRRNPVAPPHAVLLECPCRVGLGPHAACLLWAATTRSTSYALAGRTPKFCML